MKTVLIAIAMLVVAALLLGIRVLFVKGGRFPSGHASDIPALRSKGIGCVRQQNR